ncbi:MAG: UDP-N-acetylmuramoyl-tripeptide--D-alanyl-D-alanine ligase [Candidatus Omnitrophota bacterium]|jgi:UDP-N-acetylmuramoyl-tripeptide--D-alanyl-D-alanine ligase
MWTIRDILQATGGVLQHGNDDKDVKEISIDSRTLRPGALFVAIKGKNFDGHQFVNQAFQKGARGVVISEPVTLERTSPRTAVIKVRDTVEALGQIARFTREQTRIPVIAITGSAGKTSTKNLLAEVLRSRYQVLVNQGSFNNQIGVPLTILRLNPRHRIAVFELGTNQPGDIRRLSLIVKPDVAVYTNIGESHLEKLKSPGYVFKEKSQMLKDLSAKGRVIINNDDKYLKRFYKKLNNDRIISYAIKEAADYQATNIERIRQGQALRFLVNRRYPVVLRTPVQENIYNALAAIVCARLRGVSYEAAAGALEKYRFSNQRQAVQRLGRCWCIDDSYNANPVSMRSAVGTLAAFPVKGKKILVCGDMLELGPRSKALHQKMGEFIARTNIDTVLAYGPMSSWLAEQVRENNKAVFVAHFLALPALHRQLVRCLNPGDAVLIKASRGMHLEATAAFLKKQLSED